MHLPENLLETPDLLDAKMKLTHMLRSKSPKESATTTGDMMEVYMRLPNGKHG